MTRQDDEIARKLTTYLDRGAAELKAGTVYQLQQARAKALARLDEGRRVLTPAPAPALAGAGTGSIGGTGGYRFNARLWVGVLLIAAAAFGYHEWQAFQQLQDVEETDAAILSSELPIDAYLDKGFQNWLRTTATTD